MRLIDADKLPRVDSIDRIDGGREVFINSWISAMTIDNSPTVKAIPIDWIDRYAKQKIKYSGLFHEMLYITDMLRDWEDENGDSKA